MEEEDSPRSLLEWLKTVPDPRSRRGRSYPLWVLLAMLILAALHGEKSLRGMQIWGVKHWPELFRRLQLWGNPHAPAYSTVWEVMQRLDVLKLEEIVSQWVTSWAQTNGVSVDGKVLCGSRRKEEEEAPLGVVTAAGQELKVVLGQVETEGGELQSAIRLLQSLPLAGKTVTVDAGLLHRGLAKTVLEQGGDYLGVIKGNEPDVKEMVDDWVEPQVFPPGTGASCG